MTRSHHQDTFPRLVPSSFSLPYHESSSSCLFVCLCSFPMCIWNAQGVQGDFFSPPVCPLAIDCSSSLRKQGRERSVDGKVPLPMLFPTLFFFFFSYYNSSDDSNCDATSRGIYPGRGGGTSCLSWPACHPHPCACARKAFSVESFESTIEFKLAWILQKRSTFGIVDDST